jgi:hypothetical protein
VITTAHTVVVQPGITDWLTAVGTVAVALAAVGVALFAEWRASVRVRAERARSDLVLADERAHSDQVLADERAAADKRLKSQQEHSDRQFHAAQTRSQETEQYTEAYAVQVTVAETTTASGPPNEYGDPGPDAAKRLAALVVNRGRYAITRVTAQFSPDGRSLTSASRVVRIPVSFESLPPELRGDFGPLRDKRGHGDTLAPWDAGMRIESDNVGVRHVAGPYFVVRWVDRWGTHWEHKRGVVRYITEGESWSP